MSPIREIAQTRRGEGERQGARREATGWRNGRTVAAYLKNPGEFKS
jgi:hypothetical protein